MRDRHDEDRVARSASRLGWLIGPAIVVVTLLAASGWDTPLPEETEATTSSKLPPPVNPVRPAAS